MADADPATLRRECEVFTRLLSGRDPTEYILQTYLRAHERIPYRSQGTPRGIDAVLLGLARLGRVPAQLADAYARFFRPVSPLRQKLVLALAVLENSPSHHRHFNSAETGAIPVVLLGLVLRGLWFTGLLTVGVLVLGPVHLAFRMLRRPAMSAAPSHG